MKRLSLAIALLLSFSATAHDEGHGPKLSDVGKQGGIVAPVIAAKDIKLGTKAAVAYKAELVRSEDGAVSVYVYDAGMKPIDATRFSPTAAGVLEVVKRKKSTTTPFELKQDGGAYKGTAPKASSKPFNIDVRFKEGDKELLVAFDNLD